MYKMMSKLLVFTLSLFFILIVLFQSGAYALHYCTITDDIDIRHTNQVSLLQDFIGRRMHEFRRLYTSKGGNYNPQPSQLACFVADHAVKARTRNLNCKEGWDYTYYHFQSQEGHGDRCCLSREAERRGWNNCVQDFLYRTFYHNQAMRYYGSLSKVLTSDSDYYKLDWTNIEMAVDNLVRHPKFKRYVVDPNVVEWGAAVVQRANYRYSLSYVTNVFLAPYEAKCQRYTGNLIPTVKPTKPPANVGGGVRQEIQYPESQEKTFLPLIEDEEIKKFEDEVIEEEVDENAMMLEYKKLIMESDVEGDIRKFTSSKNRE